MVNVNQNLTRNFHSKFKKTIIVNFFCKIVNKLYDAYKSLFIMPSHSGSNVGRSVAAVEHSQEPAQLCPWKRKLRSGCGKIHFSDRWVPSKVRVQRLLQEERGGSGSSPDPRHVIRILEAGTVFADKEEGSWLHCPWRGRQICKNLILAS